ncbi:MAG TPA: flagellar filament capping protein FliD [Steroidobacteraceae bacterium]|nr:flagellar filament capping protein FliD [Steroidobacteraceae bacterium]
MSSVIPSSSASGSTPSAASASALITSTGIGSGLNISGIVSALTSAYGAAQTNDLTNRQNSLDAQVSAYGTFTSALDTLKSTLPALEDARQLAGFAATVADNTIASATTSTDAVAGQYSLLVNNLATAATLTSGHFASAGATVGTGSLTIAVGGASTSISIDTTDNTLSGIASAINSAPNNPGVTASIITTTDGARLVLAGTATGAANTITVTQSGGDGGLSTLVTGLTQTQSAQDASFSINGFPATSASNQVSKAITGVTINLLKASAANTPTTVSISPDTTAAQTSITKFVTALNGVLSSIQTLTGYDPSTQTAGPLNGNATLESFQNQLQNILDKVNSGSSGGVQSLTDLGITANVSGTYDTNSTTLGNALTASLTSIGNLLGGGSGIATQLDNLVNGYTKPGGLLDTINQGLQSSLSSVAKEQTALTAQLATYSATLTQEYNAMDTAVAALKQTQTYLTAEFNPNQSTSSSSSSGGSLSSGTLGT